MKFQVNKYINLQEFEGALNTKFKDGYVLNSWNIDKDWSVVAVFIRQPNSSPYGRRKEENK